MTGLAFPTNKRNLQISLAILLIAYSLFLGVLLRPHILGDDAAITFRYADRITEGRGFTYNDHEHVQGASNPLYTLVLAGLHSTGPQTETVARTLGTLLFVFSVVLASYLGTRLSNPWGGFLAGFALASEGFYRYQSLSGMESILSVIFGLLTVVSLLLGRPMPAGLLLGLAIWTKLDAGILALAVAGAWLLVHRRFPWKIALVSLAVALPWFSFSQIYFGSVFPNSLIAKIHRGEPQGFDPYWILELLEGRLLYLMPVPLLLVAARAWDRDRKVAAYTLLAWLVLHGMVYSLLDLGANYPWYLTVLFPALLILSAAGVFAPLRIPSLRAAFARGVTLALLAVFCFQAALIFYFSTGRDLRAGNPVKPWEAFDADRRLAGIYLDQYAEQSEAVASGFGWVAYESRRPFNDVPGLNSRKMLDSPSYFVTHGLPYDRGSSVPVAPSGFMPLAEFDLASELFPGYSWFTVFGDARVGDRTPGHAVLQDGAEGPPAPDASFGRVRPEGRPHRRRLTLCPPAERCGLHAGEAACGAGGGVVPPGLRPQGTGRKDGRRDIPGFLGWRPAL